jgi:hypothetical protein
MAAANIPSNSKVDYKMERLRNELRTEILLELEENILCYNCKLVPRPGKIYQCLEDNTHIKCSKCYETHGNCCGGKQMDTVTVLVESLLKLLPKTCKNKENGCKKTLMIEDLESHEEECIYRQIWCPCPWLLYAPGLVFFKDFPNHVAKHNFFKEATTKNSWKFKVSTLFHINYNIKCFCLFGGKLLFLEKFWSNEKHYFLLSLYGNPAEIKNYYYKIKITGKGRQKISFQDYVLTLDLPWRDILEKKDTMMITMDDFNQLAIDGQLDCEVTIKSDKEEIKDENCESGISDNDED